jgi:hypothetical protein
VDRFTKVLATLTLVTVVLMVVGDIVYAKYRTAGHRLSSTITTQITT